MKGQKVLMSRESDNWETPQDLFDELNKEFNFYLDLAADFNNSKCYDFCDDLYLDFQNVSGMCDRMNKIGFIWCNPPYSNQRDFIEFVLEKNLRTVFLLPSRTDTKMFHELIYNKPNMEIRFLKGRLKFSNSKNSAPFPSMIVVYKGKQ